MASHQRTGRQQPRDASSARPPLNQDSVACDTAQAWGQLPRFSSGTSGDLASVISQDIVPALLLAFGAASRAQAADTDMFFTARDRADFAANVLVMPATALTAIARDFIDGGFTVEQVLLELLAPVARQLGTLWDRDEISFVDVTIAVQKIQHVLHATARTDTMFDDDGKKPTALLLPAPGETHTFGLLTMTELLRHRGWHVAGGLPITLTETLQIAASKPFVMVGFSLSAETFMKATATAITRLRRRSCNKNVRIVIGGHAASLYEDLAVKLGADAVFADAADACKYADNLAAQHLGARS